MKKQSTVAAPANAVKKNGYNLAKFKVDLAGWILLIPSIACFLFFVIIPMFGTIQTAFYTTKGMKMVEFCGIDNFKVVFAYPSFWKAVQNSVMYVIWSLILGLLLPLIIAACCAETTRGRSFFRVAARMPGIIPAIASLLVLTYFFRSDGQGVLNILFSKIGLGPFKWLNNSNFTIIWIIVASTWKGAGATALLYMAAMADVPQDLYEAAALDGASPMRRFFSITWPAIKGQFQLLFVLQIIGVFQILYEPMLMTNGGPNNASISLLLLIYFLAFRDSRVGVACALGVVVTLFLVGFSILRAVLQNRNKED